jgi:hypothetical protein
MTEYRSRNARGPWVPPRWATLLACALCLSALFVGPWWLALVGLPTVMAGVIQGFRRAAWVVRNAPYEEESGRE